MSKIGKELTDALKNKDDRPPRGLWCAGEYMVWCWECRKPFVGDKRAVKCADCAYKEAGDE